MDSCGLHKKTDDKGVMFSAFVSVHSGLVQLENMGNGTEEQMQRVKEEMAKIAEKLLTEQELAAIEANELAELQDATKKARNKKGQNNKKRAKKARAEQAEPKGAGRRQISKAKQKASDMMAELLMALSPDESDADVEADEDEEDEDQEVEIGQGEQDDGDEEASEPSSNK